MVETRGKYRYTRLSLGPKGGVIASDSKDIWGNVGIAGRYWFGRKAFAPSLEFTSALVFKVAGRNRLTATSTTSAARSASPPTSASASAASARSSSAASSTARSPARTSPTSEAPAAGMFYLGFRGNILWGAPAALAVGTHAATTASITP
jgi:hypothetical protein